MKKQLKEYQSFIGVVMAVEYANTMEEIRNEFEKLDKEVFEIVEKADEEKVGDTLEILSGMLDDFKDTMGTKVAERLKEIALEKKPELVKKMTELSVERENIIESIMIVEPMMKLTDKAFVTYGTMCGKYISDRLYDLMNTVEEKLGIREEMAEIEKIFEDEVKDGDIDIMKVLKFISKL